MGAPLRSAGLAALAAGLLAAPASASTVAVAPIRYCTDALSGCRYMQDYPGSILGVAGEPGEANRMLVRRDGDAVIVDDDGANLHPGAGCVARTAHAARCTLPAPLVAYRVDGGDGNDTAGIVGALGLTFGVGQRNVLLGGPGNDHLSAGTDGATLVGGPGTDVLLGGTGDDRFFGDDPRLLGAAGPDGPESDIVDGGLGEDLADYSARTAPVVVRLDEPTSGGGQAGEHDHLSEVEDVDGGSGDDTLTGDEHANHLAGVGGADHLSGAAGDDALDGDSGRDVLSGGPGNDRLGSGDTPSPEDTDRVRCGAGNDVAGAYDKDDPYGPSWRIADPTDLLAADCESVPIPVYPGVRAVPGFDVRPHRRDHRSLTFGNPCVHAHIAACTGRISVRRTVTGRALASARVSGRRPVRVVLRTAAARRLARADRVVVTILAQRGPSDRQARAQVTATVSR